MNPSIGRQRQANICEFEASLQDSQGHYRETLSQRERKEERRKEGRERKREKKETRLLISEGLWLTRKL